jgi:hypothetical protein
MSRFDPTDPTDPTRKDRPMTTSITPETDQWIANREIDNDAVTAYAAAHDLDGDELLDASESLVIDLADLHRHANISLDDVRDHLTNVVAAAEYLLGTLRSEVGR